MILPEWLINTAPLTEEQKSKMRTDYARHRPRHKDFKLGYLHGWVVYRGLIPKDYRTNKRYLKPRRMEGYMCSFSRPSGARGSSYTNWRVLWFSISTYKSSQWGWKL